MPDRIYSVQYNGRIYDVRAADTASPDEIFAFVKQQAGGGGPQGPKEEENLLEKVPVVGGLLAGAADIPLNVVSGLANTGKSFTDVFGAENMASNALETVAQYAESLTSAQSRQDEKTAAAIRKAAEGKGIWEEVKAAARSFAVNPLDTLANVTGSALPFAAAAASGAGLPVIGALGAASGVGTVKGSISDAVYARAKEAGASEEQAKAMAEEAQAYGGKNLDQVALGGALGAVAGATGFDKVLGRAIAKSAIEDVVEGVVEKEATRGIARRVATGAGAEAIPEAAQAGQERFAQNLAERREGYDTDLMAGVAGQAAFEALAGGVLGGVGGIPGQSAPGPIATDEELAADLEGFKGEIEATGMPEAQDPAIRARAAEIMQIDASATPIEAVEQAVAERGRAKADTEPTEEPDVAEELDVGGGEPAVSSVSPPDTDTEPAGPSTDVEGGPVGGVGVPTGQPMAREGAVEPALKPAPIIPPIEEVSPQAQIAKQLAPAVEEVAPIKPAPTQVVEEAAPITSAPAPAVEAPAVEAPPVMALPKAKKLVTPERITAATEMLNTTLAAPDFEGFEVTPKQINIAAQQMVRTPGLDAPSALFKVLGIEKAIEAETAFEAAAVPEQKVSEVAGTLEQNIAAPTTVEELPELPAQEATPTVAETATVEKVALPPEVQALQAEVDQYNPGFEVRYNPDKVKPYTFGIAGQKKAIGNTAYTSIGGLRNAILNQTPIQPKQVIEGVPVKQMPAGAAKGLEQAKPTVAEAAPKGPANAGKLTPAQEQQQELLLSEIDEARKARQINNAERTELVQMLRTPQGKELAKSREWTLATAIQNDIDALTEEGRKLRAEEKLAEKQNNLTPAKKKEFKKRAEEIAARTKDQSAELAKAKSGIYKRTREKLAEIKNTRQKRIEQLKRNYERGLISEVVFRREMGEVRPEPIMFRRAKGKATGITLEELNNAVKAITSRWGARLEPKMVQSVADLPDAIRKEIEKLGRTDAFGFYKDGKAYLIADNMHSVEDVAPTLYHEALGHLGLRERFREGLDAVLDDIYRTNKGVAALADKWLSANQDLYSKDENPTARAVEEVLASASEAGPLRASRLDKLMKYIKDFARKYLGFDFKFSDREVRTILAMAHEQALSGKGTVMGGSSMMFKTPEENEADEKVADADTDAQATVEKVGTTVADRVDVKNSRSILGGIGSIITGKAIKNWLGGLMSTTASNGWIGRGGLDFMPTDGVIAYAYSKIAKVTADALQDAVDAADKMNGTRAATRRLLNRITSDLKSYLLSDADPIMVGKEKRKALPVAMDHGNYYNIDMVSLMDAKSREDALKTDQIWRRYTKLLKDPALTPENKKKFEGKLAKREAEIDGALDILSKLGAEGRKLYTRIRNANRDMQLRRQYLMDKRIENLRDAGLSDETVSKMAIAIRAEQERLNDKVNAPSKEDAHLDYPEVPLGLFHREYFPKRRYGNYWLRIKKTPYGEPILRFYETMAERDADMEAAAKQFNLDKENANHIQAGNDVKTQLGDDFDADNAFIKILNKISEIDVGTFTEAKKNQLRNDVYQMHLLNTPEGSGRKQFIKSKNRLGWSSDILRTFGATAEEYASDVSRLRYSPEIDRAIQAAKKSIGAVPDVGKDEEDKISISSSEQTLARDFISSIEKRIEGEMEPQPSGLATKIVPWMNQLAFVSFLTAPATALVQVTALPMRVAPNLWGKYGMANTTRAMGRYMNVFKNLPKFENKEKGKRKTFRIPTLMESNIIKNSGRHRDALTRATNEYGLIMPLSEFLMGDKRTALSGLESSVAETREKIYDAMTYLFDTSEQLTREVAFMATYDLEYDKLANAGLSSEERQNKAIIAAKDTVNYTLGNYTNLNRPPVMKGSELARALFLFKQYSVITTTFFVQATRAIFGKNTPRDERTAAMKEMTGVLGMGFLMGGVVGLPLYTLGMMTLQALQDATDDDEDRKKRMLENPLTADSVEMQFRYEWLPEHFGQPMLTAANGKQIKLSDIILNGAVSEATGWNFGSRVSLDLAGMWFRSPKDAETWTQTVNNALVENIPGASASLNMVAMGEEFAKGDVLKGLELGLPAMVRAPIKAYRLSEEGVRTQTEKIKLRAEDISNAEIIGAALGFNPTQVAKVQQQNRDVLNRYEGLKDEKTELLGAYKQAVRRIQNGDADGQEKAREAVEDIMEFNKKVGNPYFGISYANMYRSLTSSAAEAKYDIQGMGLNEVESLYADKLLNPK
jgi:hypothetical protein